MKEVKELTVSMNTRDFTIDIPIEDDELIETIFGALKQYVNRGFSLRVKETYVTSLSDSLKIITKIISGSAQMDEWRIESKQLRSIIKKANRPRPHQITWKELWPCRFLIPECNFQDLPSGSSSRP